MWYHSSDMSYRLIAFDMDGTLLNSDKQVSEGNRRAMKEAAAQGKLIALSTGRDMPEIRVLQDKLEDVRYVICMSGSLVYDWKEDKVIYSHPLPPEIAEKLLEFGKTRDTMIHIHSDDSVVEQDKVDHMEQFHMGVYQPMFQKITHKVGDVRDYFHAHPDRMYKINFYHKVIDERIESRKMLEKAAYDIDLVYSEISSLECTARGISKGSGLERLCEHLGIDAAETIAVGDAYNDLEILEAAGLAVAMGNANDDVKKAADVMVADNDHDGCAEAIYRYLLG